MKSNERQFHIKFRDKVYIVRTEGDYFSACDEIGRHIIATGGTEPSLDEYEHVNGSGSKFIADETSELVN